MSDGINNRYPLNQIALDGNGNAFAMGGALQQQSVSVNQPSTAGVLLTAGAGYLVKLSTGKYSTTIASSANPAKTGQQITFTVQVLSDKPGGVITLMDGAAVFATAPVTDGVAVLVASLSAGVHPITAVYSLDGKVSLPIYQTVNSQ